jgi:hypothetical protein
MRVNVIDMTDPTLTIDLNYIKTSDPQSKIIKLQGMSNAVAEMVNSIERIAGKGNLEILKIWGHGFPGGQIVSSGANADDILNHYTGLEVSDLDQTIAQLRRLRAQFTNNAVVELKGCSVGQGTRGETFLRSLAQIWGVPVRAGIIPQFMGRDWTGTVVEAKPDGSLRCNN